MARRKARALPASTDGLPVLPFELAKHPESSAEDREQHPAQSRWFREHGIDPGDWSAVYPVLLASWRAHGIPSALDRARSRLEPKDIDR